MKKEQMKYKKYIKFYMLSPVFDHLHYKLSIVDPGFNYDLDVFYSILNDLSNIKYPKKTEGDNGYIPLYSRLLQSKYGNEYFKYIRYLVNHAIISNSGYYKDHCTYYKINDIKIHTDILEKEQYTYCLINNDRYRVISLDRKGIYSNQNMVKMLEVVEVKIDTKSRVGKMITDYHNKELDRIKHYPIHLRMMKKYMNVNLELDAEAANKFVIEKLGKEIDSANGNADLITKAQNEYNQRIRSILQIGGKSSPRKLRFNRNRTNRRLDTDLTNMASDLRPFIIGYDKMSYLDLSNSQPVLFNILLKKHKSQSNPKLMKEIENYRYHTLNGEWYEHIIWMFKLKGDDKKIVRDSAKKIWMEIAYSENKVNRKTCKIVRVGSKKIFGERYPELSAIIEKYKEKKHENFSIELQKIESKIFIDDICKKLVEAGIIPYSLHDGLLVPKDKQEETYGIMSAILEDKLGRVPVISVNGEKRYPPESIKIKKPNPKISYEEAVLFADIARTRSRNKISRALSGWVFQRDGEVTLDKLALAANIGKPTLKKYLPEYEGRIKEINETEQRRIEDWRRRMSPEIIEILRMIDEENNKSADNRGGGLLPF